MAFWMSREKKFPIPGAHSIWQRIVQEICITYAFRERNMHKEQKANKLFL